MSAIKYNVKSAPAKKQNKIDSVWFETEDQVESGWDSPVSDINEYVSERVVNNIHNTFNELHKGSFRREFIFEPNKKMRVRKFYSALARRSALLKVYNNFENVSQTIDLIKYYNKYGYLNNPSHYKYIEIICRRKASIIVKKLDVRDVSNISTGKYDSNKMLLSIAFRVRNRALRRSRRSKQLLSDVRSLLNNFKEGYVNPYLSLYVEDGLEYSSCSEATDDGIPTSSSRYYRRKKNMRYMENPCCLGDKVYCPVVVPERDERLLTRLRNIIKQLMQLRKKKEYREDIEMVDVPLTDWKPDVQPEMMESENVEQQQEAGPVILTNIEKSEESTTTELVTNNFWVENSTGDKIVNQEHASSMEILARQFKWSSSQTSNTLLFKLQMPRDVIGNNPNHPAAMLFNQYAYWNGDIKVRIHINTTPFHVGKLIFSWYYASKFDANGGYRDNIASDIQLPHVCYSASEGKDVVMIIPYKNYRSMLCTRSDNNVDSLPLYLGSLRCHVFNPLKLDIETVVDGYVHVSFINNQFTGISPRVVVSTTKLVQPEMLPSKSLIKGVESTLRIVDRLANMDKPPNPAVPTMYMPQLTDSFATGVNDVNNIHVLRLDPLGQTPHPLGSSTQNSETLIANIIKVPGLLRILEWSTSSTRGYNLIRLPVSPELNFTDYYSVNIAPEPDLSVHACVLPPVSALSCINAYNRGSIKYTIEIICSRYHTGALLVSFTPRMSNVKLDTAIQSYNATLDIGNIKSYDFVVPYINERPYNPRFNRENSDVVLPQLVPTGEFNLFVLNELRTVNGTSVSIYVNIYMSAGDDFELAVPVPPLYSVCYDYVPPATKPANYIKDLGSTVGFDSWRYFEKDKNLVVFKNGTSADAVAQIIGISFFKVYELDELNGSKLYTSPFSVSVWMKQGATTSIAQSNVVFSPKYFALICVNGDKNTYTYVTAFYSLESANSYITCHKAYASDKNPYPNSPTLAQWKNYDSNNTYFYMALESGGTASYRDVKGPSKDFPFTQVGLTQSEMDNVLLDPSVGSLPSSMSGLRLLGEQFKDLKDYGRRYQLYGNAYVITTQSMLGFRIRVPITPIGMSLDSANGVAHRVTREGMIGYIASAYRFYRGSLRFKLLVTYHKLPVNSSRNSYETWYIQHKPDVMLNSRDFDVSYITDASVLPSNLLQSGYAYTAFSPHVNNSITFEIPCYIPTNLLMLQKPNFTALAETLHYTLGCFDIYGYTNKDIGEYSFTLHYALGDDMDLSCFVGFPPMVPLYTLPTVDDDYQFVQPEMDNNKPLRPNSEENLNVVSVADPCDHLFPDIIISNPTDEGDVTDEEIAVEEVDVVENKQEIEVEHEGPAMTKVKKQVTSFVLNEAIDATREEFDLEKPKNGDSIYQLVQDMVKKLGKDYKDIIISVISQLLHVLINPTVSTLVLSIITILAHMGIRSYDYLESFTKIFTQYFSPVQGEMDDNKTEKSSEEALKNSFTMAIVSMGVSLFNKPVSWLRKFKMPQFSKGLFNEIRCGALTVTACITMFRNLVDVVPEIIKWIGKKVNPLNWFRWMFSKKRDFIKKWISDVEWYTDPNNAETVKSNMKYAYHGELLVIAGRDINLKINMLNRKQYDSRYISNLFSKLTNTYQQVVSNFKSISGVGVEPYAFRLVGGSQTGKSYICNNLILNALASIGYKSHSNLVFNRPKTKHFDSLTGMEAAIYYDDFLHIQTPEAASEQIAELLTLKSKCVFIPPMAVAEEKGKAFNPLILAATMNSLYPDFKGVVADNFAWMNRFDDTIQVNFRAPKHMRHAKDCNDISYDELNKFDHCEFKIYKYRNNAESHPNAHHEFREVNVPNVANGEDHKVDTAELISVSVLNYTQIKWYIGKRFAAQMDIMVKECVKDLKMMETFRPDVDKDFNINLNQYIEFIKEQKRMLNQQEQKTIKLILEYQKGNTCPECNNPIMCCPCKILGSVRIGSLGSKDSEVEPQGGDSKSAKLAIDYVQKAVLGHNEKIFSEFADWETLRYQVQCSHRDPRVNSLLHDFVDHPCIHRYINLFKSSKQFNMEQFDNKWYIISQYDVEFELDDIECCQLSQKDLAYKEYMSALFIAQHPSITVPDCIKISKKKEVDYTNSRYYQRMVESKQRFLDFVESEVDPESWMSKHGSLIYRMCKRIGIIVVTLGAVWSLANYKAIYKAMVNASPLNRLKQNNINYAKMLEQHTITSACAEGKCYICVPQMAYDEKQAIRRPRKLVVAKQIAVNTEPQMVTELLSSLNKALKRNYFYILAANNVEQSAARCLGIRDRWFIAIDHYFDKFISLKGNVDYYYCDQQMQVCLNFAEIKVTKLKNSAIVICQLPKGFPSFKNIVNRFVSQDNIANISPQAILYEPKVCELKKISDYSVNMHHNIIKLVDDTLHIPDITGGTNLTTCEWYWEYLTSGRGLCGSILITNMDVPATLCGMHVAGRPGGGRGYAEVICRETIQNAIDVLDKDQTIVDIEIEGQMFNDEHITFISDPKFVTSALDGDFIFTGCVPSKFAYRPPTKSKLLHTICYNQITTSTYDFPHLSHRDIRFEGSPMVNGCLHHTDPPVSFPADVLDIVQDDIKQRILAKVQPVRTTVGVLSIVDSICGLPNVVQYGAMELDTSEGFPFSSVRPAGAKDKRWLFDLEESSEGYVLNGINPILIDVMRRKQRQRERGIIPITIFTDCLKDAKLPKEKCNKTRIFSISPVDFTIQFRQYFYDFTIAFQESRFNIESAVGINVDSYEWHDMVSLLLENSQKFVCGDYSKFGPRLMSTVVIRFFEIICDWYEYNGDKCPINRKIRMIMANEIAFAQHLMLNMVYQVLCGAPSGCPITTILNNGVNMFYLRTAFVVLSRENNVEMYLSDYVNHVRTFFYGDDLIMTVKDTVIDWFNATSLSEFFSRYNIKFTDALKTGDMSLYTTVFAPETSFLKRNIRRHDSRNVFTAAMDKRAIEETCNWTFYSNDLVGSSIISCESMLLNAHGHGEEYYELLRARVLAYWRQFGECPSIPCWKDVDWRIYEGIKPIKAIEEYE